jgi:signal transduction protein with GAF and PtsI domain
MSVQEIKYLSSFKDVCKAINSSLDIGQVLKAVTENTVNILNIKGCTIFLLDKTKKQLLVSSSYGLSKEYVNKGPVDSEKSIESTLKGEWVLVSDAKNDRRIQYQEEAKKEGIASILSVPMSVRGRIIGVLRLYTAEPITFSEVENEFISGLAEIGSIGIENARMYSHVKADHEKLIFDIHQWFDFGASPHA